MTSMDNPALAYDPTRVVLGQTNVRSTITVLSTAELFTVYTVPTGKRAEIFDIIELIVTKGANIDFATMYILPTGVTDLVTTAKTATTFIGRITAATSEVSKNIHALNADRTATGFTRTNPLNVLLAAGDAVKVIVDAGGANPAADDLVGRYYVSGKEFIP